MATSASANKLKISNMEVNFRKKALLVIIFAFLNCYIVPALGSSSLNVIQSYYPQVFGWSATSVALPVTIAGIIKIAAIFIFGTIIIKIGPTKVMWPATALMGLGIIGFANSSSIGAYSIFMIIAQLASAVAQLAMFSLVSNWFVSYRGRVLGIVTIGAPLNSATMVTFLTAGTASVGFNMTFSIFGIAIVLIGVLVAVLCKDTPEHFGMLVDGIQRSPEELAALAPPSPDSDEWPLKRVIRTKEVWLLGIIWGVFMFCLTGSMANFVGILTSKGIDIVQTISYLSVGALLGIPISYLFGWIDDKIGSIKATFILGICFCLTALNILLIKGPESTVNLMLTSFFIGCMTGALPNLQPSSAAFVFGRKYFMHLQRYVGVVTSIIAAFTVSFIAMLKDLTGGYQLAFQIILGGCVVATLLVLTLKSHAPENERVREKN